MLPPDSSKASAQKSRSRSSLGGSGARHCSQSCRRSARVGHREVDDHVEAAGERVVDVRAQVRRQDRQAVERLHPLQQVGDLDVGVAIVAVADLGALPEQGVGLRCRRGRIDPDRLTFNEIGGRQQLQNPREHRAVRLEDRSNAWSAKSWNAPAAAHRGPDPESPAGRASRRCATQSRAPSRCPRSSQSAATESTCLASGSGVPPSSHRTGRTAFRQRRRSRARPRA